MIVDSYRSWLLAAGSVNVDLPWDL